MNADQRITLELKRKARRADMAVAAREWGIRNRPQDYYIIQTISGPEHHKIFDGPKFSTSKPGLSAPEQSLMTRGRL